MTQVRGTFPQAYGEWTSARTLVDEFGETGIVQDAGARRMCDDSQKRMGETGAQYRARLAAAASAVTTAAETPSTLTSDAGGAGDSTAAPTAAPGTSRPKRSGKGTR